MPHSLTVITILLRFSTLTPCVTSQSLANTVELLCALPALRAEGSPQHHETKKTLYFVPYYIQYVIVSYYVILSP
jgi:hypothetical protein